MSRLLYCSHKEIYRSDGDYYTRGSWPEFIPLLAEFFDELLLMVSVLNADKNQIAKMSKFRESNKLKIVPARNIFKRGTLPLWGIANFDTFRTTQKKADVVLMAIPPSMPYLGYLYFMGKPLVVLVAGDQEEVIRASKMNALVKKCYSLAEKSAEKRLLNRSNAVICMDWEYKSKIVDRYGVNKSKVYPVPIGIDTGIFNVFDSDRRLSIRKKLNVSDGSVIGFVAQDISIAKGADTIVKVLKGIKENVPNAKLLLIGGGGISIPDDDSVVRCGYVKKEEMPNYYNAMDFFLFPSRTEGAPKVVMEASACGIPVISSTVGGIPGLIIEGETGFTVDPDDVANLMKYCRLLSQDENLRKTMGEKAREHAVREFDLNKLIHKTSDVIKSLL